MNKVKFLPITYLEGTKGQFKYSCTHSEPRHVPDGDTWSTPGSGPLSLAKEHWYSLYMILGGFQGPSGEDEIYFPPRVSNPGPY